MNEYPPPPLGWQRRCKIRLPPAELDNQGAVFCFSFLIFGDVEVVVGVRWRRTFIPRKAGDITYHSEHVW